jgi:DNA-binding PadR family transcriptional regulator
LILNAILDRPRHGYEIISVIEEKCRGGYRPSPGVVYPTLQMLEELQHARSVELEGRKVYEITDAGRQDLEAHRDEVTDFYDRLNEDSWEEQIDNFGELARLIGQLLKTVRRSARRGRVASSTITKIRDIVSEAIRQIEKVLSEDQF